MSAPPPASIHALPAELTEHILILTVAGGFPTAIAALAQTCRALHALVYRAPDQHLWREVFLTMFDDPRQSGLSEKEKVFDWGKEFRRRIWTTNYLRRGMEAPSAATDVQRDLEALETLLSAVQTALPCPPTIVCSFLEPDSSASRLAFASGAFSAYPSYPIFPPPPPPLSPSLTATPSSKPTDPSPSTSSPSSGACATCCASSSRNIAWFEDAVGKGLPPALAGKLSGAEWEGGSMDQGLDEIGAKMMQALGRVVAYTGFRPVAPAGSEGDSKDEVDRETEDGGDDEGEDEGENEDGGEDEEEGESEGEENVSKSGSVPRVDVDRVSQPSDFVTRADKGATQVPALDMSAAAQNRRARRLARKRVYNLRYLTPGRHWGPFLPVNGRTRSQEQGVASDSWDEGDEDWASPLDGATSLPDSSQLRPDWAFLGAVRVIVEANMREAVGASELSGLLWLDGLRTGSAPVDMGSDMTWFAAGVKTNLDESDDEEEESESAKARERAVVSVRRPLGESDGRPMSSAALASTCDGWDWAGVTGVWRRCICWMDYRELIQHNLSGSFNDPQLSEAVRIMPMRFRVASYSPSTVPAYPDRPTIHVVGETSGMNSNGPLRKLKGTVRVVADGSVWWSLSLVPTGDHNQPQWISEGVQVGGASSGMGVLGLWTGVQHERMDPLGPYWAWKVG